MTRLIGLTLGCLFVLAAAVPARAQDCRGTVTAAEAQAAEDARYKAAMAGDVAALEKMFGNDLVYTHSSAATDTKATYLESLRSGGVQYKSMKRSDVTTRTYGCIAILTGRADFIVSNKGQESPSNLRFTAIWAKRDGGLQFVSWQSTRLTTP